MSPRERDEHPLDYDHEDDDIRRLAGIIERLALRPSYQEGGTNLNAIVLSCAGVLCLSILGIGAWGISTLVSTREELAGVRVELRNVSERLDKLEKKP